MNFARFFRGVATAGVVMAGAVLGRAQENGAEFRSQLIADLRRGVEHEHGAVDSARAAGKPAPAAPYVWVLSAMTTLHAQTRDARLLAWAKDDLLWMVKDAAAGGGAPKPLFSSFRYLPPFCETFLHLQREGQLSAAEIAAVSAQISASAATHLDRTDFGTHNRALIDGAAFYYAALAVPGDPAAARWRQYGESLAADTWGKWSIEDASIYQPFWLTYSLVLADLLGRAPEHLDAVTTRFYFKVPKALIMPNDMLPDWGDGDWTHMWAWNVANLVRAGGSYRDGASLDAARRLYRAHMDFFHEVEGDNFYCLGLALRWLDPSVPFTPLVQEKSTEVIDDLVSKKITFRSAAGDYGLINYRDQGPYARYERDYINSSIYAPQEKPHHGHADENSFVVLMADKTVLLADGGYLARFEDGWRADVFHNRVIARTGFPPEGDIFDYIKLDVTYHAVSTEKIHFGTFGSLDYSRTRLDDRERGYTGDRIVLFAPESGLYIVVDSLLIEEAGNKIFCNTWHPDKVIRQGDDYVVSWPDRIAIRKEYWPNPHNKELLIQFLGNRDKVTLTKEIGRRFNRSTAFYQYFKGYYFKGQRLTFVTVLRPHAPGSFQESMLHDVKIIPDPRDDGRTLGLTFSLGGEPVTVGLKLDQTIGLTNLRGHPVFDFRTGAVAYGELRTDADFAFVRSKGDGTREVGMLYGSEVEFAGKILFDMPLRRDVTTFGEGIYAGAKEYRLDECKDKMPRWHEIVR
ncbi:MAG: hypothetical protein JWM88_1711 [Verrucomicrobia bacterium]|nr:hypothetical protein [Verrucomicrobiota bacterium]